MLHSSTLPGHKVQAHRYASAVTNLSAARYSAGEIENALKAADQSLAIRPRNPAALHNRAQAFYHRREYDQAIADFSAAIDLAPKTYSSWLQRGNAYLGKREWDGAKRKLQKIV